MKLGVLPRSCICNMGAHPLGPPESGPEAEASSLSGVNLVPKVDTPLIEGGPLDRRYAVNWSDGTETDTQYLMRAALRYMKKERDR